MDWLPEGPSASTPSTPTFKHLTWVPEVQNPTFLPASYTAPSQCSIIQRQYRCWTVAIHTHVPTTLNTGDHLTIGSIVFNRKRDPPEDRARLAKLGIMPYTSPGLATTGSASLCQATRSTEFLLGAMQQETDLDGHFYPSTIWTGHYGQTTREVI